MQANPYPRNTAVVPSKEKSMDEGRMKKRMNSAMAMSTVIGGENTAEDGAASAAGSVVNEREDSLGGDA